MSLPALTSTLRTAQVMCGTESHLLRRCLSVYSRSVNLSTVSYWFNSSCYHSLIHYDCVFCYMTSLLINSYRLEAHNKYWQIKFTKKALCAVTNFSTNQKPLFQISFLWRDTLQIFWTDTWLSVHMSSYILIYLDVFMPGKCMYDYSASLQPRAYV